MGGSPRMPSVVSRAREPKPTNRMHALLIAYVHPRTASPSLCSCPASDRASSFLLASALLFPPPSLATRRWARREMRPTDFCHPCVRLRAPAPRSFPDHSAPFGAWAPRGFWDPRGLTGGPGVSHRQGPLRRIELRHFWSLAFFPLPEGDRERGRCLPTVPVRPSL
jgi:hypothetical protein